MVGKVPIGSRSMRTRMPSSSATLSHWVVALSVQSSLWVWTIALMRVSWVVPTLLTISALALVSTLSTFCWKERIWLARNMTSSLWVRMFHSGIIAHMTWLRAMVTGTSCKLHTLLLLWLRHGMLLAILPVMLIIVRATMLISIASLWTTSSMVVSTLSIRLAISVSVVLSTGLSSLLRTSAIVDSLISGIAPAIVVTSLSLSARAAPVQVQTIHWIWMRIRAQALHWRILFHTFCLGLVSIALMSLLVRALSVLTGVMVCLWASQSVRTISTLWFSTVGIITSHLTMKEITW